MLKIFLGFAVLLAAYSTEASARSGTPQEQEACSRDVSRFCRKVIDQGDFTILACLKENRSKLTKACNQVLVNNGQ
jgi:hypothetical protein